MEMKDHHHYHHQQQQQQYDMATDLRNLSTNHFPSIPGPHSATELLPGHRNLTPLPTPHNHHHQHHQQHYEMMMLMPRGLHANMTTTVATASASTPPGSCSGLDAETAACFGGDAAAATGRWPRQETLTLLEVRSRLDPKFKEANQKGPLWDEVSRIMSEEHGYQRSGKKCREKFENLYKYYKKTKDGKAGRHDGKHYRFFRQLEALYGENTNPAGSAPEPNFTSTLHFQTNQEMCQSHQNNKHCDNTSLSLTNSTEFDTSSSDDGGDNDQSIEENEFLRRKRRSRRSWKVKIKDFIDSQMKKLVEKQEEWLDKLVKTMEEKEKERMIREEEWKKQEACRLEREQRFWAKERAWIEARDASLMEALQNVTGSSFYFNNNNNDQQSCLYNQGSNYCDINDQRKENIGKVHTNDDGSSPSNFNVGNVAPADSCNFPFLMSEGGNWWESYGLKLRKENQNH